MKWIPPACVVALFVLFFGPVFWNGEVLAFRDTAHYYYPLFHFVLDQWREGRVPLWNPYDGLGTPLAADPTSFALYPGLLLVAIGRTVGQGINFFILSHLGLAAWGAYRLARTWGAGQAGAALAAISYAFGGVVLFQYSNLVYLVGASWLPVGVWAWDQAVRQPRPAHTAMAGLSLAAVILGGDFQTAYHLVLLWILYLVIFRKKRAGADWGDGSLLSTAPGNPAELALRPAARPDHPLGPLVYSFTSPYLTFACALLIGLGTSCCLWLPATELGFLSDRQITDQPRSVYEWLWWQINPPKVNGTTTSVRRSYHALLGQTLPGTHHAAAFEFSVAPTRWAELIWPNFSGRLFPHNHRWLLALKGEDRIWTPSLYQGFLIFVLALLAFRLRPGTRPVEAFLTWTAAISLLASLGRYGLGALAEFVISLSSPPQTGELPIGPGFGGIYWLATVLLPGYVSFRYPAKWLPLMSLAISQLAARAFTERPTRNSRALALVAGLLGVASTSLFALVYFWQEPILQAVRQGSPDPAFGPLVPTGVVNDLLWAFGQVAILGLSISVLRGCGLRIFCLGIVVLTAVDISLANRWLVQAIPEGELAARPAIEKLLKGPAQPTQELNASSATLLPFPRIYRSGDEIAPEWQKFSSPRRLVEMSAWQRDSLFSKFHLLIPAGSLSPGSACRPADWQFALWVAQKPPRAEPAGPSPKQSGDRNQEEPVSADNTAPANSQHPGSRVVPPGTTHALVGQGAPVRKMVPIVGPEAIAVASGLTLWRVLEPPALAWFPQEVLVIPELSSRNPPDIWQRTAEVLFPDGQPREFSLSSVLEVDSEVFALVSQLEEWRATTGAEIAQGSSAQAGQSGPAGNLLRRLRQQINEWYTAIRNYFIPAEKKPTRRGELRITNNLSEQLRCRLLRFEPGEVWLQVQCPQGGLLAVAQQYFPGWQANLEPVGGTGPVLSPSIWRMNRVMQAVLIPPGEWLLRLRYTPWTFWAGVAVSLVSFALLTIWLAARAASLAKSPP
ncbi:MAG: YfhO family protein [Thermoguttaceae bacterium]|nr:YfhO family protein [Thermoguttaceae bacterium]MDW8077482.1 hypothetical protein [Thermoguttaceae bacterium]